MTMRYLIGLALGMTVTACAAPTPAERPPSANSSATAPPADASGSAGAGRVAGDAAPPIDPISLIGTWSFDRTCASGDGMRLAPDGTASYDEWGHGSWAVDVDHRLVLIVREQEMGKELDPLAERRVLHFTASRPVGDDFVARLSPWRAGEPPRDIQAKRCPEGR